MDKGISASVAHVVVMKYDPAFDISLVRMIFIYILFRFKLNFTTWADVRTLKTIMSVYIVSRDDVRIAHALSSSRSTYHAII